MPGQATYFADIETGLYLDPSVLDVQIEAIQHRFRLAMFQKNWDKCFQILDAIDELIRLANEADKPVLKCLATA